MMRVTNTTFNMIAANRRQAHKDVIFVQRLKKDGEWGKPLEAQRYGKETDDEIVERLNCNNPNSIFRIAGGQEK